MKLVTLLSGETVCCLNGDEFAMLEEELESYAGFFSSDESALEEFGFDQKYDVRRASWQTVIWLHGDAYSNRWVTKKMVKDENRRFKQEQRYLRKKKGA